MVLLIISLVLLNELAKIENSAMRHTENLVLWQIHHLLCHLVLFCLPLSTSCFFFLIQRECCSLRDLFHVYYSRTQFKMEGIKIVQKTFHV